MSHFGVVPNLGSYRSTVHECKLVFQMKTKIQRSESSTIPLYGLSLTKCADLKSVKHESVFLTDVIGLLSGMSAEREYMKDGKKIKMIIIEITNDSGKIECALFGEYAEMMKKMMESVGSVMPVVVLQFTKLKIFRENVSLQNIMGTTRIMLNPDIPEVVNFKNGLAVHGVESNHPVAVIGARSQVSKEDDFLNLFPKQTIGGVKNSVEDGIFVVYGSVTGLVKGEDFWYPACKCHKSVTPDSGSYYCSGCVKHVFQIVPRYRLKMYVSDGIDEAVFVMFDSDLQQLLGKTCAQVVSESKAVGDGVHPSVFDVLIGKELLFKVEKKFVSTSLFDSSFRVKRACDDSTIISSFMSAVVEGNSNVLSSDESAGKDVGGKQDGEGSNSVGFLKELTAIPKCVGASDAKPSVISGDESQSIKHVTPTAPACEDVVDPTQNNVCMNKIMDENPIISGDKSQCFEYVNPTAPPVCEGAIDPTSANVYTEKILDEAPINLGDDLIPVNADGNSVVVYNANAQKLAKFCGDLNETFRCTDPSVDVDDSVVTPVTQNMAVVDGSCMNLGVNSGPVNAANMFVLVPAAKVNKPCVGKRSRKKSVASLSAKKNLSDVFDGLEELDVKVPFKVVKTEKH